VLAGRYAVTGPPDRRAYVGRTGDLSLRTAGRGRPGHGRAGTGRHSELEPSLLRLGDELDDPHHDGDHDGDDLERGDDRRRNGKHGSLPFSGLAGPTLLETQGGSRSHKPRRPRWSTMARARELTRPEWEHERMTSEDAENQAERLLEAARRGERGEALWVHVEPLLSGTPTTTPRSSVMSSTTCCRRSRSASCGTLRCTTRRFPPSSRSSPG